MNGGTADRRRLSGDAGAPPAKRSNIRSLVVLAAFCGLLAAINLTWLQVDRRPTDMDQGRYMLMVVDLADELSAPGIELAKKVFVGNHPSHPHLVPLVAAVSFVLSGGRQDGAYLVNTLFLVGLVLVSYRLAPYLQFEEPVAKRVGGMAGRAVCGLLAPVLVAGMPSIGRFSRYFLLELPATFFVVLGLWMLVRGELDRRGRPLVLGLVFGLALLTKWTTVVFLGPAWLVVLAAEVAGAPRTERRRHWVRVARRMAVTVAGACAVAAPWYLARRETLLAFVSRNEGGPYVGAGAVWGEIEYYARAFVTSSGWLYTLIALGGTAYLVWRPGWRKAALLAAIICPFVVFTLVVTSSQDVRHLLPAFPLPVVGAAATISSLRPRVLRAGLAALCAVTALVSFHRTACSPSGQCEGLELPGTGIVLVPAGWPPDRWDWRFDEILATVARDWEGRADGDREPIVRVVAGNRPFRPNGFAFEAAYRFPSLRLAAVPFFVPRESASHRHLEARRLLGSDYLVAKSGDLNGNRNRMMRFSRAVLEYLRWSDRTGHGLVVRIDDVALPNGQRAAVYRVPRWRCDRELLTFLDWAHETDPDDPSIAGVLETCSHRVDAAGSPWEVLSGALPESAGREDLRDRLESLATEGGPGSAWSRRLLAASWLGDGRWELAARALEAGDEDLPYRCSLAARAGFAWVSAGQPEPARAALLEGLAVTPDCLEGQEALLQVFESSGDVAAVARQRRILEIVAQQERLGPIVDTARFRVMLGDEAAGAGRPAEAIHHYERAVENEPTDPVALAKLREARTRFSAPGAR